jgi:RNAse (barnase) inhibitor barstar
MRELILDGTGWKTSDDVYDAFFRAVGAPSWHGRNFNAIDDSIANGGINAIDPPYSLVLKNYDRIESGARQFADDFVSLIQKIGSGGVAVEVYVERSAPAK